MIAIALVLPSFLPGLAAAAQAPDKTALNEELWDAARAGDAARVARALDKGADVNSGNRYKAGALFFAADRGHVEVIKLLLDRGADINVQDTFYKFRPIVMALMNGHVDAAKLLLDRGATGASDVLSTAIQRKDVALATAALQSKDLTAANLKSALAAAKRTSATEIVPLVEKKLASLPPEPAAPVFNVPVETLQRYAGRYTNDSGVAIGVALTNNQLVLTPPGQGPMTLVPVVGRRVQRGGGAEPVFQLRRTRRDDRAAGRDDAGRLADIRARQRRGRSGSTGGAAGAG